MNDPISVRGPRYAYVLLSYNHAPYVELALEGIYSQECSDPLRVIVCDDASTDSSREVIDEWLKARGVQPIRLYSQRNAGTAASLCKAAQNVTDGCIIVCASDDVSAPNRYQAIRDAIRAEKDMIYGGFSDIMAIDEKGNTLDPDNKPSFRNPNLDAESIAKNFSGFLGASSFYHRDVFACFEPINNGILHEDMVLNFRASLLGKTLFLKGKLVRYRQHSSNVHYFDRAKSFKSRLEHAIKIGKSLQKVAEQRCADLIVARLWIPSRRADLIWNDCVYWRSTHRMKIAVLSGRVGVMKALRLSISSKVCLKEIAKAAILSWLAGLSKRANKSH